MANFSSQYIPTIQEKGLRRNKPPTLYHHSQARLGVLFNLHQRAMLDEEKKTIKKNPEMVKTNMWPAVVHMGPPVSKYKTKDTKESKVWAAAQNKLLEPEQPYFRVSTLRVIAFILNNSCTVHTMGEIVTFMQGPDNLGELMCYQPAINVHPLWEKNANVGPKEQEIEEFVMEIENFQEHVTNAWEKDGVDFGVAFRYAVSFHACH